MTVRELIELLEKIPGETPVYVGVYCDGWGELDEVEVELVETTKPFYPDPPYVRLR